MALGEDYFVLSHNNSMANYTYMYTVYDVVVLFTFLVEFILVIWTM